jgi:hypothetical protein
VPSQGPRGSRNSKPGNTESMSPKQVVVQTNQQRRVMANTFMQ